MDTVTREESSDVVNTNSADDGLVYSDPRIAEVNRYGPARTTEHRTETITGDPYAGRREGTRRVQGLIYLLFGILEGLLAIRFVLPLLGANPAAGFSQVIYGITAPFLAPFTGLFGTETIGGSVFEVNPLVAMLIYALIAWVLVKAVGLVMGETRRGVHTSSSQLDTQTR
jgi:YggT family protein